MKSLFFVLIVFSTPLFVGMHEPCIRTISTSKFHYTEREYPECSDTLNYVERKYRNSDSTLIGEHHVVNGLKHGKSFWHTRYRDEMELNKDLYEHGRLIRSEWNNITRGTKISVYELVSDSIYKVLDYHENGVIKSSGFEIVDIGLRTKHWVYYDSLGRKLREGHYLPMHVFDTIYTDNDPQKPWKAIIIGDGAEHGEWILYDSLGQETRVMYEFGRKKE
jgi:hypothetical protein